MSSKEINKKINYHVGHLLNLGMCSTIGMLKNNLLRNKAVEVKNQVTAELRIITFGSAADIISQHGFDGRRYDEES